MPRRVSSHDGMATCGRCLHAKRWHRRGPCGVVQGQCQCPGWLPASVPFFVEAGWLQLSGYRAGIGARADA